MRRRLAALAAGKRDRARQRGRSVRAYLWDVLHKTVVRLAGA